MTTTADQPAPAAAHASDAAATTPAPAETAVERARANVTQLFADSIVAAFEMATGLRGRAALDQAVRQGHLFPGPAHEIWRWSGRPDQEKTLDDYRQRFGASRQVPLEPGWDAPRPRAQSTLGPNGVTLAESYARDPVHDPEVVEAIRAGASPAQVNEIIARITEERAAGQGLTKRQRGAAEEARYQQEITDRHSSAQLSPHVTDFRARNGLDRAGPPASDFSVTETGARVVVE